MTRILISIALRNVVRHGKRTLITAIVMTVGIGMFIFFDSILAGMDRMTIDSMIDYTDSSLVLMTKEYHEDMRALPLDHGLTDATSMIPRLKEIIPEAKAITPRTSFVGYGSNRIDGKPIIGTVVDAQSDTKVFKLAEKVSEGSWFQSSTVTQDTEAILNEVLIGKSLAGELDLVVGDWLVVQARAVDDSINADEFKIIGIIDVPAPEISASGIFMTYPVARKFLGSALPVSELDIALPRQASLDLELSRSISAAEKASSTYPGIVAVPIGEAAKDYMAMRNMKAKYSMIIILIVLLIAGVGIVNTILMSVYSRIKEIGVLRAYGMRAKEIQKLFSIEGIMIGVVGSLGGAVFGGLLVWWSMSAGIPLDALIGKMDMGSLPLAGVLRGEFHPQWFGFGIAFGILSSWIAARIPARKASKLEVTDALRFV